MKKLLIFTLPISCFLLSSCHSAPDFLRGSLLPFFGYLAAFALVAYALVWLCYKSVLAAKSNCDKEKRKWSVLIFLFSLLVALLIILALGQYSNPYLE